MKLVNLFKSFALVAMIAMSATASAAVYSAVEMTNINVKGQGEVAKVAPGETFGISANYEFLMPREKNSIVQIIVGYEGIGAQTCIANALVNSNGKYLDHHPLYFRGEHHDVTKKKVNFAMVAPEQPGVYEIRFRYAQAYLPTDAVKYWWNVDESPTADATIATIIVE